MTADPGSPVPDPPEVLFVCVHNAGRSQMAAALLEQHAAGQVVVRSAGSAPADDLNRRRPNGVPALSRSTFTRDDLTQVTPESHKYCSELLDTLTTQGRYTPWGLGPTLVLPGTLGGATWSGVSFDPTSGYVYVNANEAGASI